MSAPAFEVYRGVLIRVTGVPGAEVYTAIYQGREFEAVSRSEIHGLIDDLLGYPEEDEERPEETQTYQVEYDERIASYLDCIIYLKTTVGLYWSPCVPTLLGSYPDIRRAIEAHRGVVVEEELVDEEIITVEIVETPALPFYAAWLAPIAEYLGAVAEALANHFTPILNPIGDGVAALAAMPRLIFERLGDALPGLIQKGRNKGTDIAVSTLREVQAGTEPWMDELAGELDTAQVNILGQYTGAVTDVLEGLAAGDTAAAAEALEAMKGRILQAAVVNFALHAALEAGTLGQIEFMKDLDPLVVSKLGLDQVIARATLLPIEKAVLVPAEQEYNRLHPNQLPTPAELIQMVVKEVITLDDFKAAMRLQGIAEGWSQAIWDAHFIPPSYGEIRNALYRGIVSPDEFEDLKTLVDLDPRFKAIWDGLLVQIPPVSELINQRVREVLTQEQFEKFLGWYGYPPEWAARIWDAHFLPPNLNDLLTAWRRGLIDTERLDELMVIVDLDPRFKDIFDTRRYNDPTLTQARFMFETGAIDEARVHEIALLQGFRPEDATDLTEWVVRFQERRFRTSYLLAMATATIYGAYSEEELRAEVQEAGYTDAVATWIMKIAEVRAATTRARAKAPAPKLLNLGDLKRAYRGDIIDEDRLRLDLSGLNYEIGDVDILVELLNQEKVAEEAGGRKIALSQSELLNAWRYDQIGEDYVRTELALRGMEQDEIDILIKTKKAQWDKV